MKEVKGVRLHVPSLMFVMVATHILWKVWWKTLCKENIIRKELPCNVGNVGPSATACPLLLRIPFWAGHELAVVGQLQVLQTDRPPHGIETILLL
jgi:hypothetical protein